MRACLAKWLVRRVAKQLDKAVENNFAAAQEQNYWIKSKFKHDEMIHSNNANDLERFLFPIAKWLDKEAYVDQLIEEGYWG